MADTPRATGFSLRRWSERKLAAGRGEHDVSRERAPLADRGAASPGGAEPIAPPAAVPSTVATTQVANAARSAGTEAGDGPVPLPPLDSLTIDSDFSPFMQPGVDETVKRLALRKLLRDPRFNVMDGLDVYIDDYSKPSPIEPALARTLAQARYILDPPKTRITAEGIVEDAPDEPVDALAEEAVTNAREAAPAQGDARAGDAAPASKDEPPAAMPAPTDPPNPR